MSLAYLVSERLANHTLMVNAFHVGVVWALKQELPTTKTASEGVLVNPDFFDALAVAGHMHLTGRSRKSQKAARSVSLALVLTCTGSSKPKISKLLLVVSSSEDPSRGSIVTPPFAAQYNERFAKDNDCLLEYVSPTCPVPDELYTAGNDSSPGKNMNCNAKTWRRAAVPGPHPAEDAYSQFRAIGHGYCSEDKALHALTGVGVVVGAAAGAGAGAGAGAAAGGRR